MNNETRSADNYISTPSNGETTIPAKVRDDQFYFTSATFEVEGVLFRVPRHPFENESDILKNMLALSIGLDEGRADDIPIALHGVTVKQFRAFLRVLFDPAHGVQGDLNEDEWCSVLHLTHLWSCSRLFALATSKLEGFDINPVSGITMAKAYNITAWLQPAYFHLVTRTEPLTLEEANELGLECAIKLAEIRESCYRSGQITTPFTLGQQQAAPLVNSFGASTQPTQSNGAPGSIPSGPFSSATTFSFGAASGDSSNPFAFDSNVSPSPATSASGLPQTSSISGSAPAFPSGRPSASRGSTAGTFFNIGAPPRATNPSTPVRAMKKLSRRAAKR